MIELQRMAMVLHPKPPFVDWLHRVLDGVLLVDLCLETQSTVVLIPLQESDEGLQAYLEEHYQRLLENEFSSWCQDRQLWPQASSYGMFQAYFSVEFHSLVMDDVIAERHRLLSQTIQ